MTRHHIESNINIALTRNLPIDSGIRHWSHPLMIPLRCLWVKSNNRTRGQFECGVTWFYVVLLLTCTVRFLFHSLLERVGGEWGGWGFIWNWSSRVNGGGIVLYLDGQGCWGFLKIRQFSLTTCVYRP